MFSALNVEKIAASIEKATFDFFREINGAPAKNCSGPEKRVASIFIKQKYSKLYDFFDRSRSGGALGFIILFI